MSGLEVGNVGTTSTCKPYLSIQLSQLLDLPTLDTTF
jgi:hypothetical protein